MQRTIVMGADIGQLHDPTAVVVAEVEERQTYAGDPLFNEPPVYECHFHVRHLERLGLGTPYPDVAAYVCRIARRLYDHDSSAAFHCLIDATGVGRPVVDLVRRDILASWHVTGVTITGSDRGDDSLWFRTNATIGKAYLVSRLQTLMQCTRVHLPRSPEMDAMVEELLAFEVKISPAGHDTYSAPERVGAHDDTITALALCCACDVQHVHYGPSVSALFSSRAVPVVRG